ncbi:hypothetical protein NDU88_006812 [Pleurodeles waltl]|uniref:Retrotransposon gag domain-containing protein n=1 Tax=Pleurodeles waltl TaxID=8319 RepID=A0AAV7LQ94_PLEWA|nr:hypothetical protein NDU88_006812 [Pleurodeles waltl]
MQNVTAPPFFLSDPGEPVIKWKKWKNIFENYARVCGTNLSGERKQALLLHCLGGEGQEVLENIPPLLQADQRGLNEYEICARQLDLHYLPKISTIMERYHFGLREQGKEESVEEYITALRKLASSCKFGALVEERIRDQFVLRCCSDKVREELWLKDEPPLDEVVSIAKRVEHMLKCVGELSKAHKEDKVSVKAQEAECQVIQKDEKEKKYEGVREKGVVIENSAGKTQGNRRLEDCDGDPARDIQMETGLLRAVQAKLTERVDDAESSLTSIRPSLANVQEQLKIVQAKVRDLKAMVESTEG